MSNSSPARRRRRSRSEWQSLLDEYATSGLSPRAFCDRHDLGLWMFRRWKRELGTARRTLPVPAAFVEVPRPSTAMSEPEPSGFELELELPEGVRLVLRRR